MKRSLIGVALAITTYTAVFGLFGVRISVGADVMRAVNLGHGDVINLVDYDQTRDRQLIPIQVPLCKYWTGLHVKTILNLPRAPRRIAACPWLYRAYPLF